VDAAASSQATAPWRPGALFGIFPGPNRPFYPITNANYVNGLPELGVGPEGLLSYLPAMQSWQGRKDAVFNVYSEFTLAPAYLFDYWLPATWDTYHAIPMITLDAQEPKDPIVMTSESLANGDWDPLIVAWATHLKQFIFGVDANGKPAPPGGRRAYIRFFWEANARFAPWSPARDVATCEQLAANEETFVAMWRHSYDLIMSTGGFTRDQVAWVFSVFSENAEVPANCPNGASDLVRAIYPGDEYVDWVGIDGYGGYPWRPGVSASELFGPMVSKLRSITTRPVSINEVGTGTLTQADLAPAQPPTVGATPAEKGAWIADYFDYIAKAGIGMSLWFNVDKESDWAVFSQADNPADPMTRGNCTYTAGGVTYNTYCEYAAGIRSQYFTASDPKNPRVVTDAEFLGTFSPILRSIRSSSD
jgi:hypothetical protein